MRRRPAWTLFLLLLLGVGACGDGSKSSSPLQRPNFVWIVAEDMNLELGSYGDPLARTPRLDQLASEGTRFTNVFSTSGVCAPSRTALITGMYATSIGAQHMRTMDEGYLTVPPPEMKAFPELLRAAGYYTSNQAKTDYQFGGFADGPFTIWDESGPAASWRGRKEGQPFFAYFTSLLTHESALYPRPEDPVTDPASVVVPPYYPDTPLVRRDLARHYDNIAAMDRAFDTILDMLEEDGLADDTIVVFLGDNGRGLPRDKRTVHDGGIHVPMLVRWPDTLEPGSVDEQLVSFIDLAPTMLALAGVEIPSYIQGRVFLGRDAAPEPPYVFAAADRHDDALDRIRAVRDRRYKYIRNYHPELPYGLNITFRNGIATMQEIFRLHDAGGLAPPADWYYRSPKPVEELYDVESDPYEIEDRAGDPQLADVLTRMREAHEGWLVETNDLGAIPEADLAERFWPGGIQPLTAAPVIEPGEGRFDDPVEVTIHTDSEGASIGYTLDGDSASPHWLLYAGPILLTESATLRAKAVRYGWAESGETRARLDIAG